MNKEQFKGAADKAKDAFKDTVGKMTGDKQKQDQEKLAEAKAADRKAIRDVMEAASLDKRQPYKR